MKAAPEKQPSEPRMPEHEHEGIRCLGSHQLAQEDRAYGPLEDEQMKLRTYYEKHHQEMDAVAAELLRALAYHP